VTFAALGLSEPMLRAVAALGFEAPTKVQAEAVPAIRRGDDVWATAPTGSGKTAAFLLPLLDRLAARRQAELLVLVPTRELAAQTLATFERLRPFLPAALKACVAVGGGSINPQLMALRGGVDVVIATPGRLLDLVAHNGLRLSSVATLVLDEADRMLSLGFADELAQVLALLPPRRQNLLFSATFPPAVQTLAAGLLSRPTRITVGAEAPVITQRAILVDASKRVMLLRHLLATHGWSRVLVFVASGYRADHVATKLERAGIAAAALHGGRSQASRTKALDDFKAERVRVLVATDVAARGIDIARLPAVVNDELPRSAVDYLHRIGRTGRAGEPGVAVSFLGADDAHFAVIEKRHRLRVPREQLPGFEPTDVPSARDANGGVKGRRKSKKDKLREAAAEKPR
jgi:ATP-dependent RNA helicase RhlE